ncbi:MAG: hypothetical protein FJ309_06600 [Planctomycetes bacterium]|nr:hypothetical protein [Planctomycetota bacterium]
MTTDLAGWLRAMVALALVAVLWGCAGTAEAQMMGPGRNTAGRRPSVSPYMAMAGGGGGGVNPQTGQFNGVGNTLGALNAYANITQPGMQQQRMQAQQSRLGGQVGRLQTQLRGTKVSAAELASGMFISPTGRAATFSNFLHYYPNKKSSGR